eukprot:203812-Chlamydomonas_euryale.AAC.7
MDGYNLFPPASLQCPKRLRADARTHALGLARLHRSKDSRDIGREKRSYVLHAPAAVMLLSPRVCVCVERECGRDSCRRVNRSLVAWRAEFAHGTAHRLHPRPGGRYNTRVALPNPGARRRIHALRIRRGFEPPSTKHGACRRPSSSARLPPRAFHSLASVAAPTLWLPSPSRLEQRGALGRPFVQRSPRRRQRPLTFTCHAYTWVAALAASAKGGVGAMAAMAATHRSAHRMSKQDMVGDP